MSTLEKEKEDPVGGTNTVEWVSVRENWTRQAIQDKDVKALRKISALPGGFGGDGIRKKAWSTLLKTHHLNTSSEEDSIDCNADTPDTPDSANIQNNQSEAGPSTLRLHPNERQVKLDTDRSFVTYPKDISAQSKSELQDDLNDLIVGILRKYPALHYFQGYHDILSVLYLTFIPPKPVRPRSRPSSRNRIRQGRTNQRTSEGSSTPKEVEGDLRNKQIDHLDEKLRLGEKPAEKNESQSSQTSDDLNLEKLGSPPPAYSSVDRDTEDRRELRKCAEMVSLNRVRDAMGSGMEGMMGLLRILKRILKAADPELSKFSAKISPVPTLPFFALSWVLTLFSHDCDSLLPIQRMFDFLLARNPISAVYLAAAILMLKKPQMLEIAHQLGSEYEEDPTLLHPLFVRLPPLYADTPSHPEAPVESSPLPVYTDFQDETANPYKAIKLSGLFQLTDTLMTQYPWDGDTIRGKEIMGDGSVVNTYEKEEVEAEWSSEEMLKMVDVEVVKPGSGGISDDEDEEAEAEAEKEMKSIKRQKRKLQIRIPRNKVNTALAIGIMFLGIGMAVYGFKAGGNEASWSRWWGYVIRGWIGKEGRNIGLSLGGLTGHFKKFINDYV
ncbi:uncharacterized protein L201_006271 [Kwoniella dendrophila CBS 6074]|uniref:Rab-GAP TBC domain-containing protein n=1 Tax=Kwoniella dendrophila CBS 6074 TaxID=1295534 RepID=A0AAX4K2C8_9TREE